MCETALCLEPVLVFDKDILLKAKLQEWLSLDCSIIFGVLYLSNSLLSAKYVRLNRNLTVDLMA